MPTFSIYMWCWNHLAGKPRSLLLMFNRLHTPIFKISTSYLNFYKSLHLGKRCLITDNRYNHLILEVVHSRQQVPGVATFKSYEKVTIHKKRAFVRPSFSILLINVAKSNGRRHRFHHRRRFHRRHRSRHSRRNRYHHGHRSPGKFLPTWHP